MDDKKENKGIPPKSVITIRLLVGCYLLYIDYSVIQNIGNYEGGQKLIIIACLLLFLIVGAYFVIVGARYLWLDWKKERAERAEEEKELRERKAATERSIAENAAIVENTEAETEERD
ncbi:MAG TPA: hypothetical protein DCL38_07725 [Lachnospiraceae bacterium]|nr:hypothetical protein [Lachnospiraceae bacterium]